MLSDNANPVYAVKYAENEAPIICFSKKYSNDFNPKKEFGAIMTCNNADEGCPLVIGADGRFPIKYDDPKSSDNTPEAVCFLRMKQQWLFIKVRASE